jgi:hypothetical protein
MKLGAICYFDGFRIPIPEYIAVPLGLRKGTSLVIGLWNNSNEMIVTPIPKDYWAEVYEFSIPIKHTKGSSAGAAKSLAEMGANILISESTVIGFLEKGFWNGVVHFPKKNNKISDQSNFRKQIINQNKKEKFLPELTSKKELTELITLRKLKMLEKCNGIRKEYIAESCFDGHCIRFPKKLLKPLSTQVDHFSSSSNRTIFLAVDLNERLLTFTFPTHGSLYHVNLPIYWPSSTPPIGIYSEITRYLSNKDLNILRSYDYIIDKKKFCEESLMHFIVEGPPYKQDFVENINEELKEVKVKKYSVISQNVENNNNNETSKSLFFIPEKHSKPKCFIARLSNLKNNKATKEVCKIVKDLGFETREFDPKFDETNTVIDAILNNIKECCCLVNIVMPHAHYIYVADDKKIPVASPWLVAEDAIAQALGLQVFRIIDKQIEKETVSKGKDSIMGNDLYDNIQLKNACNQLKQLFEEWMQSPNYIISLGEAAKRSLQRVPHN